MAPKKFFKKIFSQKLICWYFFIRKNFWSENILESPIYGFYFYAQRLLAAVDHRTWLSTPLACQSFRLWQAKGRPFNFSCKQYGKYFSYFIKILIHSLPQFKMAQFPQPPMINNFDSKNQIINKEVRKYKPNFIYYFISSISSNIPNYEELYIF